MIVALEVVRDEAKKKLAAIEDGMQAVRRQEGRKGGREGRREEGD